MSKTSMSRLTEPEISLSMALNDNFASSLLDPSEKIHNILEHHEAELAKKSGAQMDLGI